MLCLAWGPYKDMEWAAFSLLVMVFPALDFRLVPPCPQQNTYPMHQFVIFKGERTVLSLHGTGRSQGD